MTDRVSAAREYARIIEQKYFTGQRVNHVPTHVVMARMHIKALLGEIDKLRGDNLDGEQCQDCGVHYMTVYHVPANVWSVIRPNKDDPDESIYGGLLCPSCADRRAREAGIALYFEASIDWWISEEIDEHGVKIRRYRTFPRSTPGGDKNE